MFYKLQCLWLFIRESENKSCYLKKLKSYELFKSSNIYRDIFSLKASTKEHNYFQFIHSININETSINQKFHKICYHLWLVNKS